MGLLALKLWHMSSIVTRPEGANHAAAAVGAAPGGDAAAAGGDAADDEVEAGRAADERRGWAVWRRWGQGPAAGLGGSVDILAAMRVQLAGLQAGGMASLQLGSALSKLVVPTIVSLSTWLVGGC
jgi:hypothetical protein